MDTLEILKKLNDFFTKFKLDKPLRIILGYSGGLDSSTLLFLLDKVPTNLITIVGLAHINHNLREESENDAVFAGEVASEYRLPYFYLNLCPLRRDVTNEAWGREIRYSYFEELRLKHSVDYVLTAHHLDDEIETFIFRLIMGRNNPSMTLISEVDDTRRLLRPFIGIPKSDLLKSAVENKVKFIKDKSNDDSKYARNYVRNELLPKFEKINPSYKNSISQYIGLIREDCELISNDPRIEIGSIEPEKLILLPDPLALRGLIALVRSQIGDVCDIISARKYRDLLSIIKSGIEGEKLIDLGSGMTAILDMREKILPIEVLSNLELRKRNEQISKHHLIETEIGLDETVVIESPVNNRKIFITLNRFNKRNDLEIVTSGESLIEYFGLDLNQNKVKIKGYPEGEFIKVGVDSKKRISRLIKESKIPKRERSSLFYISEGDELLWIPNLKRRSPEMDLGLEKYSITVKYS